MVVEADNDCSLVLVCVILSRVSCYLGGEPLPVALSSQQLLMYVAVAV